MFNLPKNNLIWSKMLGFIKPFKTTQKANVLKGLDSIAKNSIFFKLWFKTPFSFVPLYCSARLHIFAFFFGQLPILDIIKIWQSPHCIKQKTRVKIKRLECVFCQHCDDSCSTKEESQFIQFCLIRRFYYSAVKWMPYHFIKEHLGF